MIKIHGQIGSFIDETGNEQKGVELIDVIAQVNKNKEATEIIVEINSPGGIVDVGYAIHDYLISLKKQGKQITTVINGLCASIATVISLAGDKRQIVRGSKFLIHNPYVTNASGDADTMKQYAAELQLIEDGLAKFYSQITGISKEALDLLMKENKEITEEKALELGFVTEIVDGVVETNMQNRKIFALIKTNKQEPNMSKLVDELKAAISRVENIFAKKGAVKNLTVTTEDGKSLEVEGEELKVGAMVTMEGNPTPDATYTLSDGTVIKTDAESKISEITTPQTGDISDMYLFAQIGDFVFNTKGELMKSKTIKKGEVEIVTDENGKIISKKGMAIDLLSPFDVITLKKENETLKVTVTNLENSVKEATAKIEVFSKLASNYTPEARKTVFAKAGAKEETLKEKMRARKEQLTKK